MASMIFYVSFTTKNGQRIAAGPMTDEQARGMVFSLNRFNDITDRNIVTSFPDCMRPDRTIEAYQLDDWIQSALAAARATA